MKFELFVKHYPEGTPKEQIEVLPWKQMTLTPDCFCATWDADEIEAELREYAYTELEDDLDSNDVILFRDKAKLITSILKHFDSQERRAMRHSM